MMDSADTEHSLIKNNVINNGASVEITLRPEVILHLSDHFTRERVNGRNENFQVYGALMGKQSGRFIEVTRSFPLTTVKMHSLFPNYDYLMDTMKSFGSIYKDEIFVGWYVITGLNYFNELDHQMHNVSMIVNENPIILRFNPFDNLMRVLPIEFYESNPAMTEFVLLSYSILYQKNEMICIAHVSEQAVEKSNLPANNTLTRLNSQLSAIRLLMIRQKLVIDYLQAVASGTFPINHSILRKISAHINSLLSVKMEYIENDLYANEDDKNLLLSVQAMAKLSLETSSGLFNVKNLNCSDGFLQLANDVHAECNRLCAEAQSTNRKRKMAECVRLLHPDPNIVNAADEAVYQLGALIERLNTSTDLFNIFRRAVEEGDIQPLDEVDRRVGELLLADFKMSGVHLPELSRKKFVRFTEELFRLGSEFMRCCDNPVRILTRDIAEPFAKYLTNVGDGFSELHTPLLNYDDHRLRKFGYLTYFQPSKCQETKLKNLLHYRDAIATLVGYRSYADRAVQKLLLNNSSQVESFLKCTLDTVYDQAMKERSELAKLQDGHQPYIWDLPYLCHAAKDNLTQLNLSQLTPFLNRHQVINNLSIVLNYLYGVRIVETEINPGEVWHDSVTKWLVQNDQGSTLGVIYCDWIDRRGKVSDSHFTIRCGKQLPDGSYQQPIVVLSFRCRDRCSDKAYFTLSQLENFLHEMGHALHSIFGRTRYQHVSGTRCATDFAEVPSNLMENFMYNPKTLRMLTEQADGSSMSDEMIEKICRSRNIFGALELVQQILMSLCDLKLHQQGPEVENTVDFCRSLYSDVGFECLMPEQTAWQHRFSHFIPYGSKYHTYLVAKAVSLLLWRQSFEKDPLNRQQGDRWRRLQSFGGERSVADLLEEALGYCVSPSQLAHALRHQLDDTFS
ncbi:Mitochondrial intermediate peptidase [Trichinella pseudospiralis]|uniref:Mitochondrial intermediate peptidase n=1 Tax=Trichinella pseudospiralis TaxID=6337 RepID=A0A0V1J6R4_TRIPS|nr:Mitochondrial intermediate peptidase [Trichinella pseudospiralis]KRZ25444.1 Mitochondrial intermediate peptidase [Trichinella pseudospiralis]KRZ30638.1 Mitochondrial intermediate peptidase [Trichinella pseudospiralis]